MSELNRLHWLLGFAAHQNDIAFQDNPFPAGTLPSRTWSRGWRHREGLRSPPELRPIPVRNAVVSA